MRQELQEYLYKKFPEIYPKKTVGNNPFDLFGFECDDGWFRLILWLSRYIQQYTTQQNEMASKYPETYQPVKQLVAVQVKEKFGTLRFYTEGGNDHLHKIVEYTEFLSGYFCEMTGKIDNVGYNRKGWVKTRNVEHANVTDLKGFYFVDDEELRKILQNLKESENQLKLNL